MTLLALVVSVIGGGMFLLLLARFSRRKNKALGKDSSAWGSSASNGNVPVGNIFFGNRSRVESFVGLILAWTTIIVVVGFLIFSIYLMISTDNFPIKFGANATKTVIV